MKNLKKLNNSELKSVFGGGDSVPIQICKVCLFDLVVCGPNPQCP
ncbi:bacteriocin-like protein [Chryseobacterium sp. c4a]